jgi:hypothetical protein
MYEKAYIMMYILHEIYRDCESEKFLWLMVTQAKKVGKDISSTEREICK